jgi:dephospho-CoA kinase
MSGKPLVIGLAGPNAAGKGEVARLLQERGYAYHSLSDVVREESLRRGLTTEREDLISVGRDMRRRGGTGVLAEWILERLTPPCIVDSVRNPGEVEVLKGVEGFHLLGVDASPEVRLRRLRERGRPGDPTTLEEFLEKERIENSSDPEGQQICATMALSNGMVRNDTSLAGLESAVEKVLREWEQEEG